MTDEYNDIRSYEPAAAEILQCATEAGWSATDLAAACSIVLGNLAGQSPQKEQAVLAAFEIIEARAGCTSNATLAIRMPCPSCWKRITDDARAREHTGTALTFCADRKLAVELAFEAGVPTAWHLKPATAEELAEYQRQRTADQFREGGGLSLVH